MRQSFDKSYGADQSQGMWLFFCGKQKFGSFGESNKDSSLGIHLLFYIYTPTLLWYAHVASFATSNTNYRLHDWSASGPDWANSTLVKYSYGKHSSGADELTDVGSDSVDGGPKFICHRTD